MFPLPATIGAGNRESLISYSHFPFFTGAGKGIAVSRFPKLQVPGRESFIPVSRFFW